MDLIQLLKLEDRGSSYSLYINGVVFQELSSKIHKLKESPLWKMITWFSSFGFSCFILKATFPFFSLCTVRSYFEFSSSPCLIPGDVRFLSELLVLNNWKDCVRKGKRDEGCESCNQTLEKIAAPAGLWSFLLIYKSTVVCMKCMKMDFVKSVIQI